MISFRPKKTGPRPLVTVREVYDKTCAVERAVGELQRTLDGRAAQRSHVLRYLGIAAVLMRKNDSALVWAIVAAVHGLIFGALCSIPYLFIGGWTMALSYWVSGIPFDLIHCGGNFVMTLVLYKPLKKGMEYALHGKTKKTLPEEKPET